MAAVKQTELETRAFKEVFRGIRQKIPSTEKLAGTYIDMGQCGEALALNLEVADIRSGSQ